MKDITTQQRNSSIELLKIFAIILIVLSHSVPDGDKSVCSGAIDIFTVTSNIQLILAGYMKNMGQIGNDIFIVCSAWFLLDSNKVKSEKITNMIGDCFIISVVALAIFSSLGYKFPIKYFIKQLFPVTFSNYWFLTCYLLLYAIHPLLNIIIRTVKKEALLCFVFSFFILYNCMGVVMQNGLFYYSDLIGFIGIYFFVAYIKKYFRESSLSSRTNVILLILGLVGWIISSCLTALLGNHFVIFEAQMQRWNNFMNPCFLLIAISLFNLFKNKVFYNKHINYISSMSLLIYMIHTTRIMSDYVIFDIFLYIKNMYGYEHLFSWIMLFAAFNLAMGVLLSIAYNKTIQKYVHAVFENVGKLISCIYMRVASRILCMK